jgi:hypothetical protein
MADPETSSSLTVEEALLLIEGWLRSSPGLSFKQVRADARNLNVAVTARQYSEAKRRLGITGAAPRPTPTRVLNPKGSDMNGSDVVAKTPLMNFIVEFLRNKPDATYQEVRDAGTAATFQIAPINYGNARRMLGMAAKSKTSRTARRRRLRQVDEPTTDQSAAGATSNATGRRRGRKRKLDFGNLSNLVAELQDVVSERDRLLTALDQIADIIRKV